MAITGRFEADFQSFYDAVDKGDAKLADFQSGAGRVETALNKMVDNFSGRRLLQEATVSAEAVERIGGVSKLTGNELQALAVKASAAADKMRAMGVDVPPGIAAIASQLKPVNTEVSFLQNQVEHLGERMIEAFAIRQVVEFALNVGQAQKELSRLSDETHISVDDIQTISAATQDYGISNEELARGLFHVSQGLAGGDESVVRGLHLAGISIDDIKNKNGKEMFLDIEAGLSTLQGKLRDTAAADIFGSRLGVALAGFANGAQEAVDKADQLDNKLSKENIENLKNYADEVDHMKRNLANLRDTIVGGSLGAIHEVENAAKSGTSWWHLASSAVKDYFAQLTGGVGVNLINDIAASEQKAAAAQDQLVEGTKNENVQLSAEAQAVQFLATLRRDSAKELTGFQTQALDELRSMGQLNQQNAAAIGVGADQFKQYTEHVKEADSATKLLTASTLAQREQLQKLDAQITTQLIKERGTQTDIELQGIKASEDAELHSLQKRTDALKAALTEQHADTKDNLAKVDADSKSATDRIQGYFDKLRDGVGIDFSEIASHTQAELNDAADRAKKTYVEALSTLGVTRAELDKLRDKWREVAFAATAAGQAEAAGQKKATAAIRDSNAELVKQFEEEQKVKEAARSAGGSIDITAANFDKFTAPAGIEKSGIGALLKQGFSLQNAIDVLEAQARGVGIDLSKWPADARGPRVPGFKYGVENFKGGPAVVGEDGPELLNLPTGVDVIPLRGGRGGGSHASGIYAPVFVSGVFDPSSSHALGNTVSGALLRGVSNARILT